MAPTPPPGADRKRWQRIETICERALPLDPAARDAYLDQACGGDDALRHDVTALLAQESAARSFLSASVGAVAAAVMTDPPRNLIGTRLGDYEVTARLGEGGMGEVYRARDHKLGRDVAIKVLPAAFADDAERLTRFEREARLLATLNHSGIGAIYGLIDDNVIRALVLELIDGQTLGEALARGPLPTQKALSVAAQIADALDHAHRRGIIHRDLKPSNVMLTSTGVKLLDFGVGKWKTRPVDGSAGASTLTAEGSIVGTLHYMSPEQLEGRDADARSDIFSFGAVLYELLTSRKAFDGASQAGVIAAVMEAPAPRLPHTDGPHARKLDRIIAKCLAKQADERWQSAGDLADELRWLADDDVREIQQPRRTRSVPAWQMSMIALLAVTAIGATSWRLWPSSTGSEAPGPAAVRFEIQIPRGGIYANRGFDLSGDGTKLVFADTTPGGATNRGRGIWVRRFDRLDSYLIPGTASAGVPRFSPDGESLVYWQQNSVRRVRVAGDSPPEVIAASVGGQLAFFWMPGDSIAIASPNHGLRRLNAAGGQPTEFTTIDRATEVDHHSPSALPGGTHVLMGIHGPNNRFSVAVQSVDGQSRKVLLEPGFDPTYLPSGHLIFGRGTSLMAAPFDLSRLAVTGPPVAVLEHVDGDPASGLLTARVSSTGVLAYIGQAPRSGRRLIWVDRQGKETPLPLPPGDFTMPRVAPDGRQLAYVAEQENGQRQIWTFEFASGRRIQWTRGGDHWAPLWSKDGESLIFSRKTAAGSEIVVQPLHSGDPRTLAPSANRIYATGDPPGGRTLLLSEAPPTDEYFVSTTSLERSEAPTRLAIDAVQPEGAKLSPDGRWIAFAAASPPAQQVFVQRYPPSGRPRQVSIDGGHSPVWSHDGRTLFFRNGSKMFELSIDTASLTWTPPRFLFNSDHADVFLDYDLAPDGRFVMVALDPQEREPVHFNVVLNWLTELRSRVPGAR